MNNLFEINKIKTKLTDLQTQLAVLKSENKNFQNQIGLLIEENERRSEDLKYAIQSIDFIEKAANHERSIIKDKVQTVISDALIEIYGNE